MRKKITIFSVLIVGLFAFAALPSQARDGHEGHQHQVQQQAPKVFDSAPPVGAKATCPVMGGGEFTVTENSLRSEHNGKHVVFCCPGCKPKFEANPEQYLK